MPVITIKEETDIGTTVHSTDSQTMSNDQEDKKGFSARWTAFIRRGHVPILKALHGLAHFSAVHPKMTVCSVIALSVGLFILGIATNFTTNVDEDILWTPKGSPPVEHMKWIDNESGFPTDPRNFIMFFHASGSDDILGQDEVERIFQALDAVRSLEDYQSVCAAHESGYCDVGGVTKFWNNSAAVYAAEVFSDEDAVLALSAATFPSGAPVSDNDIFGFPLRANDGTLTSIKSYTVKIELPETDDAESFEEDALDVILDLDDKWERESGNKFRVEVVADRSFSDEFERAIVNDIPLIPIVFIIMSFFTCLVFFKKDKVRSRSLLGLNAVVSVVLSLAFGYGVMFVSGVPFTSMTQILPFVIFGIGLDDAFIISGSFGRTDPSKDIVERIEETVDDIGLSIFLTSLTSTTAFGLGCLSDIPAVFWLCLYAFPTIVAIFLFQMTYFIACITLDERRIQDRRRDCLTCITAKSDDASEGNQETVNQAESKVDLFMAWYGEKLLKPWVKGAVILCFTAILIACSFSAAKLEQAFEFTDVLPSGSYVADFFEALDDYSARSSTTPGVYFRNVDQSDPAVQDQMEKYVNELITIEAIVEQPAFFWLRDFKMFVNRTSGASTLDFNSQVDAFLSDSVFRELYGEDIIRDNSGSIVTSRLFIPMDNVDLESIDEQIDALKDQRAISDAQAINKGKDEYCFFTYEGTYNIWEFFSVVADEIRLTTILGVSAVTFYGLVLIPHWTAALFVLPLISVLYLDLLGVLQWAGVRINPVSYISLVMSIGLLVDFIMHPLLRFYEAPGNRREKAVDMLKTMGSSVLIGGISTFLGTIPLAFSSSDIFNTIFIAFLGLVTLGVSHGLILLPVVLNIIGPEDQIKAEPEQIKKTVTHQETAMTEVDLDKA